MGCATSVVKYLVFIFNLLFAIAGLGIIIIGVLFKLGVDADVDSETSDEFSLITIVLVIFIVLGVIIFVISFFGCCGAIRESNCMLSTYAIMLIILLLIQIGIGVYLFVAYKDEKAVRKEFSNDFKKDLDQYDSNEGLQRYINYVQRENHCCGADGPHDYTSRHFSIPPSCCINQDCSSVEARYQEGCVDKVMNATIKHIKVIGYVVIGIAVIELIGAIFGLCLVSSLRNQYRRGTYA